MPKVGVEVEVHSIAKWCVHTNEWVNEKSSFYLPTVRCDGMSKWKIKAFPSFFFTTWYRILPQTSVNSSYKVLLKKGCSHSGTFFLRLNFKFFF